MPVDVARKYKSAIEKKNKIAMMMMMMMTTLLSRILWVLLEELHLIPTIINHIVINHCIPYHASSLRERERGLLHQYLSIDISHISSILQKRISLILFVLALSVIYDLYLSFN